MDTFEFLKYMVEEEHKALDQLLDKITDEMLSRPLYEGADSTIGERFRHILGAEYRMANYLYETQSHDPEFSPDLSSIDGLKQASEVSMARHFETLDNLSPSDLEKVWTSKASGNSYSYKYLVWHFIEHISTHRGQVATAINRYLS
ncbi:MAG: DinB family protein [Candidatus Kariarchaeaceae archaeon]|jgi:uncharacterized damage-inducible protein DinB